MPVEIKELIIRTNIVSDPGNPSASDVRKLSERDMREVIEKCVERVLKIMDRKNER